MGQNSIGCGLLFAARGWGWEVEDLEAARSLGGANAIADLTG
jgi:hypothetical protein